ncbi:primosomal protein N' [Nocardia lasii]|uniref:Probable replication restart protein PriA n=1 Tax=Nocardia lasii TaxID=1616107 RepID=A0ABW1JSG2_9NOCA
MSADDHTTAAGHPIARVLPLLSPAHLDRDFDYLVPAEFDEIAQPGVRVRVRFAGRLVDGYLLERLPHSDHNGKLMPLDRVVSPERVLTPDILHLITAVAARYAGTRADVLRLAIPPRHARTETGGVAKNSAATKAVKRGGGPLAVDARGAATETPTGDVPESASLDHRLADEGVGAEDVSRLSGRSEGEPLAREVSQPSISAASDDGLPDPDAPVARGHSGDDVLSGPGASVEVGRSADAVRRPTARVGGDDASRGPGESEEVGRSADAVRQPTGSVGGDEVSRGPGGSVVVGRSADAVRQPTGSVGGDGVSSGSGVVAAGGYSGEVDVSGWGRYVHGAAFVGALAKGKGARAAWQALPGEDWAARWAELAATVVAGGRSAVLMVPDQRDLDRLLAACVALVGDSAVGLSAGLGPAARYRRWLAVLRGQARIVVGTRAAVFAPVQDLGLIAIWDDGDDTYAEPRSPYPHAREVAMLRAHETGAAFVAAGFARTAEIQAVVESGWARDLLAERHVLRAVTPRISAPGDSDYALERDALARSVRMPGVAFAAARSALKENAAVLVQVPRRGYVPSLACAKCRHPARCRHCNGPLALPHATHGEAASPQCKWCGITEAAFRCQACGARTLRATVVGATRTAEELGRAFAGVPVRTSGGGDMLDTVEPGAQVVVATVGAEPLVPGGYGVALLLDGWALLGRADLRAGEDTLRRWMGAAALVRPRGQVIVMAEPGLPTVQALVRWDPVNHAAAELAARAEVGFPPAVRLAAVDGTTASIAELLDAATLPEDTEILGPVPLPPTARKPFSGGDSPAEVERMLLRVPRSQGAPLARALGAAQGVRSSHRSDAPLRVQIDPVDIG